MNTIVNTEDQSRSTDKWKLITADMVSSEDEEIEGNEKTFITRPKPNRPVKVSKFFEKLDEVDRQTIDNFKVSSQQNSQRKVIQAEMRPYFQKNRESNGFIRKTE